LKTKKAKCRVKFLELERGREGSVDDIAVCDRRGLALEELQRKKERNFTFYFYVEKRKTNLFGSSRDIGSGDLLDGSDEIGGRLVASAGLECNVVDGPCVGLVRARDSELGLRLATGEVLGRDGCGGLFKLGNAGLYCTVELVCGRLDVDTKEARVAVTNVESRQGGTVAKLGHGLGQDRDTTAVLDVLATAEDLAKDEERGKLRRRVAGTLKGKGVDVDGVAHVLNVEVTADVLGSGGGSG